MKSFKYFLSVILLIAIAVSTDAFHAGVASADAVNWMDENGTVQVADDEYTHADCQYAETEHVPYYLSYAFRPITSEALCITHGKDLDIGTSPYGDRPSVFVKFHTDAMYRMLNGIPHGRLVAGTNSYTYVTNDYMKNLKLIKDLASSLEINQLDDQGQILSYKIKEGATVSLLPDKPEYNRYEYHTVSVYATSQDGRYIAAYVDYKSLVKIDLEIGTVTKVYLPGGNGLYNYYNPNVQAISDDGRYILIGNDATVIDTNQCGRSLDEPVNLIDSKDGLCPGQSFSSKLFESYAYSYKMSDAHFIDDGYGVEFSVTPWDYSGPNVDQTPRHVTIHAAGFVQSDRLEYLALGDSYSSGEGDIESNGGFYLSGTAQDGGCHISSRSYPFLLRDMWHINSSVMKSLACSGARVLPDYYGGGAYFGQGKQLINKSTDERESLQKEAIKNFTPGVARQLDFVATYKPKVLTFTGGGNDVGFADILNYCASSYKLFGAIPTNETCIYAYPLQMRADLNRTIDDQYGYNKQFIEKIKEVSPETKIYMIGYPQFVAEGWTCVQASDLLNEGERKMIRESVTRLNNILKKVARDTDVYYVDIEDSLAGGQVCEGSQYMTGPVKLGVTKIIRGKTQEAYHPNSEGHKKIAEAIDAKINTNLDYEILDIPTETQGRKVIKQAVMADYAGIGSNTMITVSPGIFKSNGDVKIELFSQATDIITVPTSTDGSLQVNIVVPKNIGIGTHLLTLTGVNADNEPIQVQQFINVVSNDANDIDNDGILNADDNCFVISEWNVNGKNACLSNKNNDTSKMARDLRLLNNDKSSISSLNDNKITVKNIFYTTSEKPNLGILYPLNANEKSAGNSEQNNNKMLWWIVAIATIVVGVIIKNETRKNQRKF